MSLPPAAIAIAAGLLLQGGDGRAQAPVDVLVELFSSEGCSSCPPAEAVLAHLVRDQPVAGAHIVGLGEHVDYWDGAEWRDRFSSPAFSRRQERYAQAFATGPYTPQAVIDGRRQVIGGDERSLRAAIAESVHQPRGAVTLVAEPGSGEARAVRVEASWDAGVEAEVYLASVEHGLSSAVTGGENGGRLLRHAPVARALVRLGTGAGAFRGTFTVPIRPGAGGAQEAVVFVQRKGQGPIVATGALRLSGS